ncbi:MAG: 2-phosphosulfolactate phosphatase [Acidimicrobiales bacterium]
MPVHLEWGRDGLREGGRLADVVVVVDVLSFSTAVTAAAESGVVVYPLRENDDYGPRVADKLGAHLADRRGGPASLSPRSLAQLPSGDRVVLPSPNGGRLALEAAAAGATVVVGSLRNASAVGAWLSGRPRRGVVVAAGEQWRDGSPRFAVEDFLGAGAILAAAGHTLSAEAQVAADAFVAARPNLAAILHSCTSGRELAARGYSEDIRWAADLDASSVVPVLTDGGFRAI